jgi:hypothetical protein
LSPIVFDYLKSISIVPNELYGSSETTGMLTTNRRGYIWKNIHCHCVSNSLIQKNHTIELSFFEFVRQAANIDWR